MCRTLNWHTLIPEKSPYLNIETDDHHYQMTFNHESMWLLKKDVVLLPLENVTLETLSQWFVDQVMHDKAFAAILETISAPRFDPDQLKQYLICKNDCVASPWMLIISVDSLCCIYFPDSAEVTPEAARS